MLMGGGIDHTTSFFMKLTAIVFDLLSAIPIVGSIVDFIAAITFGMWFAHHGVYVMKKRPLGFLGTIVAEFIPFIEVLPFWSVFVWTTIKQHQQEQAQNGL